MTKHEMAQLTFAAKTNAPLRKLLAEHERQEMHLGRFMMLAAGVTGADANDTIGSIKVHYSDGSTMYLADAFDRAVQAAGRG